MSLTASSSHAKINASNGLLKADDEIPLRSSNPLLFVFAVLAGVGSGTGTDMVLSSWDRKFE